MKTVVICLSPRQRGDIDFSHFGVGAQGRACGFHRGAGGIQVIDDKGVPFSLAADLVVDAEVALERSDFFGFACEVLELLAIAFFVEQILKDGKLHDLSQRFANFGPDRFVLRVTLRVVARVDARLRVFVEHIAQVPITFNLPD